MQLEPGMPAPVVERAAEEYTSEGRTISGTVLHFEKRYPVVDRMGRYDELWETESVKRSLSIRQTFPLMVNHRKDEDPIGSVSFHVERGALNFEANIPETSGKRGDHMLELIKTGAMQGVSIGSVDKMFQGIKNVVVRRKEMAIRELSITPFPQIADGAILAVRADVEQEIADFAAVLSYYRHAA